MGSSETQNVQRGIIFMLFFSFILLAINAVYRLIKKKIDPIEEDEGGRKEDYKESQENMGQDMDKIATKKTELAEDASCIQKFLYGVQEANYYYAPLLILLPLNIITGTSKSFCFILLFVIAVCQFLFNGLKLHKKCSEHKCVGAIFENLWLILSFFFFVNHWGAMTIIMPYSVQ